MTRDDTAVSVVQRSAAPGATGHDHRHGPGLTDDHGHDHGADHDHDDGPIDVERAGEIRDAIWATDNVELTTVGVDVGSATSHLMFSRIHLHRQGAEYSSRFVVVSREPLHRSAIHLTPYRADGLIDAAELGRLFDAAYDDAGLGRDDVDAGAVILTGVALERSNARAIAELFAAEGGRFVCATAGHNLEALLAANGSGAVARSRSGEAVLNVDVGGGTTKLAWCVDGRVTSTMAIAGGARLLAVDPEGRAIRIESRVASLADDLGIALEIGAAVAPRDRRRLAEAIAADIAAAVDGSLDSVVVLAGERPSGPTPAIVVLSGGVAELVGQTDPPDFGDLGPDLANALVASLARPGRTLEPSAERIRATVVGASQFSVQLSGNTVHLSDEVQLPLHGIPVVAVTIPADDPVADVVRAEIERAARQLDLDTREEAIAIALTWDGEPAYRRLRAIAEAIATAHRSSPRRDSMIVVAVMADIGASLGAILESELGIDGGVIAIDGLELADLDFIDIGERILPANVVPVVVKSLVFPSDDAPVQALSHGAS